MKIDCYLSYQCSSEKDLLKNINQALDLEGIEAHVHLYRIDEEEFKRPGLSGSPSIFINGEELQPQGDEGVS